MNPQITKADIETYRAMQKSPTFFVTKMWGLIAQPIKEEHKFLVNKLIEEGKFRELKPDYFQTFIKNKHITWQQWQLLLAVERGLAGKAPKRISVVSGHGTGKSCAIAWLILWHLFCFKDAQIPCTAPTSNQMHDILWKELAIWHRRMPKPIQAKYEWTTEYMRITESPETWFARARTASKENSEALAGVHGDHVMGLVDEASGVVDDIYNTAEGAMTGPNVLFILISNGTRLVGYFYDTHHSDSSNWQTLRFNAEESPIVDNMFVQRIIDKHGKDSDEYSIRVQGGFGHEEGVDEQGYVPLLVEADLRGTKDTALKGRIKLGIDPAKDGGDEMAQVARDNFKAKVMALERVNTPKSIASIAVGLIKAHGIDGADVAVDNFGEGANVTQEIALTDTFNPIRVNGVNVGDEAEDIEMFMNRRAELAWRMRTWIKAGGELVDLENWRDEILALRYRRTVGAKSRIQLMDKRTMRKLKLNHGKSPNKADALMLTFNTTDQITIPYVQPAWETMTDYE